MRTLLILLVTTSMAWGQQISHPVEEDRACTADATKFCNGGVPLNHQPSFWEMMSCGPKLVANKDHLRLACRIVLHNHGQL